MRIIFSLIFVMMLSWGAAAQMRSVPQSEVQLQLSYAPVVKQTAPAVVNIYTKRKVVEQRGLSPLFSDPFFQQFFGNRLGGSMQRERVVSSLGSGVIVSDSGHVVTSFHVIKGAEDIIIGLSDRREFSAQVVRVDEQSDLALLEMDTEGEKLPYLPIHDSDLLEVGDLVLAIGNPFGV
ncbi:MAG: serine protease, partial [Rickettsiales bacterium]|nr:serine protease [Rickettsiales bacterium]